MTISGPGDPAVTTTVPTIDTADSVRQTNNLSTALEGLADRIGNKISDAINHSLGSYGKLKDAQTEVSESTGTMDDLLGAVSLRITGASKAFDVFKEQSVQISSFTDQLASMGDVTKLSTDMLSRMGQALGLTSTGAVIEEIKKFGGAAAAGADSALKLQQGYISMQAATGGLGTFYKEAGSGMENLNEMLQKQSTLIMDTARATGTSAAQVMGYYKELGDAIPGSIDKQVNATSQAGTTMGNLQAVMSLATGTGMSQKDVVESLTKAWTAYGLEGDDALQFTERMSDLSTHLGVNLQYAQKFILDSADAFQTLSDHGTNAGDVLNEMFDSFKNTGLSAKQSADMISGITKSVSGLTVAQKAFLSAQTGGPGGLRGAFQIENMIRSGDIQGVINKQMESLKKQFGGKIYTQEEAGQSDQAASQFLKQREFLKSGAFGGMVKDDATATRLLEAMKGGMGGTAMKDVTETLKDSVGKGADIQERSYSKLTIMANALEAIREEAGIRTLGAAQRYIGGTERTDRGVDDAFKRATDMNLDRRTTAMQNADATSGMIGRHSPEEKSQSAKKLADDLANMLPASMKPGVDKIMSGLSSTTKTGADQAQSTFNQMMQSLNDQQKKGSGTAFIEKDALNSFGAKMDSLLGKPVFEATPQRARIGEGTVQQAIAAAPPRDTRNMGAVQQAIDVSKRETTKQPPAPTGRDTTSQAAPSKPQLEFTIKGINVVCDKCGNTMKPDAHTTVTTAGQTT